MGKTSDQQVFNAMVRKERQWPGVGGRRDSWLMRSIHADWDANLTLGALPLPLFANGHGHFVQSAHLKLKVRTRHHRRRSQATTAAAHKPPPGARLHPTAAPDRAFGEHTSAH